MSYTISEAAEKTGIPPSTIRYYDKEGLLPNIKRKNGIRVFEDIDLRLMGLLSYFIKRWVCSEAPVAKILNQRANQRVIPKRLLLTQEEKTMGKTLVAYFSASGTTAKVAKKMAEAIGADLFEIQPETPYTGADLNWQNKNSRSSVEMKDRSSRPAIAAQVADMAQYSVVFVGFPVWWYREPSIIDTFMESYDFAGKTVVPFATSGGSGLGESAANMQKLAKGARVVEGKRFSGSASIDELRTWAGQWA